MPGSAARSAADLAGGRPAAAPGALARSGCRRPRARASITRSWAWVRTSTAHADQRRPGRCIGQEPGDADGLVGVGRRRRAPGAPGRRPAPRRALVAARGRAPRWPPPAASSGRSWRGAPRSPRRPARGTGPAGWGRRRSSRRSPGSGRRPRRGRAARRARPRAAGTAAGSRPGTRRRTGAGTASAAPPRTPGRGSARRRTAPGGRRSRPAAGAASRRSYASISSASASAGSGGRRAAAQRLVGVGSAGTRRARAQSISATTSSSRTVRRGPRVREVVEQRPEQPLLVDQQVGPGAALVGPALGQDRPRPRRGRCRPSAGSRRPERAEPALQLAGGPAGERDGQHVVGVGASRRRPAGRCDGVRTRVLPEPAGARITSGAASVQHRLALLGVEPLEERRDVHRGSVAPRRRPVGGPLAGAARRRAGGRYLGPPWSRSSRSASRSWWPRRSTASPRASGG